MADNVGYTPGTGATVAADDIGGVLYQRVKIGVGADGAATDVSTANPMPVIVDGTTALNVAITDVTSTNPLEVTAATPLPVAIAGPDPLTVQVDNVRDILVPVVNLLESPRGFDKSLQRQRGTVVVESGTVTTVSTVSTVSSVTSVTSVTSVSTVTTVTGLTNIDSIQGRIGQYGANLSAWADCVRARIS